jgi:hypothetical protein
LFAEDIKKDMSIGKMGKIPGRLKKFVVISIIYRSRGNASGFSK